MRKTMPDKKFPLVDPDNLWLSCFNCYRDQYGFFFFKSENAAGRGRYFMRCEECSMKTFFDFTGEKSCSDN
jgi:hypothetical protein